MNQVKSEKLEGTRIEAPADASAAVDETTVVEKSPRSIRRIGMMLIVPLLGPAPIAVDFAFPLSKDSEDETQVISFSFGITQ